MRQKWNSFWQFINIKLGYSKHKGASNVQKNTSLQQSFIPSTLGAEPYGIPLPIENKPMAIGFLKKEEDNALKEHTPRNTTKL